MKAFEIRIAMWAFSLTVLFPPYSSAAQKYAILDYAEASGPTLSWISQNFHMKIAGNNPNNTNMKWMAYYDTYLLAGVSDLIALKDWAAANSLNYENILLHAKVDYNGAVSPAWSNMDKFDNFSGKGVLQTSDDITYIDKSSVAYSGSVIWQNKTYLGYEEPYDQVNLVFSTIGSGVNSVWEYWNGASWSALTVTDGTTSFTQNGRVSFIPPSDWAIRSVNSSRSKYFIRCTITTATTLPVTSSIKGDNWLNPSGNRNRGWSATDGNRVNIGTLLEYNPTPPVGSSAKFPYQARMTSWATNHFVGNNANFQVIGGASKRTWSQFLAYRFNSFIDAGYTGVMGDDMDCDTGCTGIAIGNTDYIGSSWATENTAKLVDLVNTVHAVHPTAKVGINTQTKTYTDISDWSLSEYYTTVYNSAGGRLNGFVGYDDLSPVNNPSGKFILQIYADTVSTLPWWTGIWSANTSYYKGSYGEPGSTAKANVNGTDYWFECMKTGKSGGTAPTWKIDGSAIIDGTAEWTFRGGYITWDRANRGPILSLAQHLILSNDNTYYAYYSYGGFNYPDTDNVTVKINGANTTWRIATQGLPDFTKVVRWGTWFPAMGVDVGIPDTSGYNSGNRDNAWRLGANIGGGPNIWRRDYTNAVVMWRPSVPYMTAEQVASPSSSIDLGGTYFPLKADGITGAAVTSIALQYNEGAILMKAPISAPATLPAPTPLPPAATKGFEWLTDPAK